MIVAKYHALENDYLVAAEADLPGALSPEAVRALCARHSGLGSDGLLLFHQHTPRRLTIYNPDGTLSAMSGNGLRIAARYLVDRGAAAPATWFDLETGVRRIQARVAATGEVTVDLGEISFESRRVPLTGPPRQALYEPFHLGDEALHISAASLDNPHCVVHDLLPAPELARRLGPLLERDPRFRERTNVQFLQVIDPHTIQIEIWERGAGYTRASGSSSCAAAAVAVRLGQCRSPVTVRMPGGEVMVELDPAWRVTLTGPVRAVYQAELARDLLVACGWGSAAPS